MADNVAITPGTGATIATDDVSGIQFQKVKIDWGGDGATSPAALGQTTMSASLPVVLPSNQSFIPVQVVDGSGNSMPVGDIASRAPYTKLIDGTNLALIDAVGALYILQKDLLQSGNITSTAAVTTTTLQGIGNISVQITGTWVGTVQFEGTVDGTNYVNLNAKPVPSGISVTSATANGVWQIDAVGMKLFQVRCSTYTSGTIVVTIRASANTRTNTTNNDSLNQAQYNFPAGFVRTSDEPHQLFYDPFDSALDTTNRWNAAVASGGGVAASVSAGQMTLGSGTTTNGYSYVNSQNSFVPTIPSWLGNSWAISIEYAVGNNAVRFWGHGSVGGTPTSTNPLGTTGNGYGFEIDISGVLQAVVYSNGTRTVVASLASNQPVDSNLHRYICYYRTDKIYWYIDSLATPAATSNFQSPQVQTLPLLALAVAHSSAPASSRVFTCAGLGVWDTGKNNNTLSDGVYGWRKATVSSTGALSVKDTQSLVDNAVFTDGTSILFPSGYIYDEVAGTALTENDVGAARINVNRAVVNIIEDGSTRGRYVTVTSGGALTITDTDKIADNAGFTDGTTKVMPAGFIYDETAGTSLTENDIGAARINVNRATVSAIEDGTTRGRYVTVSASNALKVDCSATTSPVSMAPATSGGCLISRVLSAASTNSTSVKASAGQVYGWYITNINASPRYVKLYNKASGPTVGTDTPVMTVLVPGNAAGAGTNVEYNNGIAFATGIGLGITTGVADNDTGAVAANEVVVNLFYK